MKKRVLAVPPALYRVLALLWAAVIFYLSSLAGSTFTVRGPLWSFLGNLFHAPLFGVLGLLTALALLVRQSGDGALPLRRGLAAWLLCAVYSLVDEWHQSFVAGRMPDSLDLITDFAGYTSAILLVKCLIESGLRDRRSLFALVSLVLLAMLSSFLATQSTGS